MDKLRFEQKLDLEVPRSFFKNLIFLIMKVCSVKKMDILLIISFTNVTRISHYLYDFNTS